MSNSTSSIDNATAASTHTFETALVFNAAVFGAELLAFTLVRPYFPAIYQPRTYAIPEDRRVSPLTPSSSAYALSPRTLLAWPLAVYRADHSAIRDQSGLDAYVFVRYLRMMARVLLPVWLISWAVLLPVTSVGTSVGGHEGLDLFSFGNVSPQNQNRYAAHVVLAWLFTVWLWYNIKQEMAHFLTVRQRWFLDPRNAGSAQANTVLITGVPRRYLSENALTKLFAALPGGVRKVWLNRDLKEMPDLYDRRLSACKKLESAETDLLNTATKLHNKKLKKAAKGTKKSGKTADISSTKLSSDIRPLTAPSIIESDRGDDDGAAGLVEQLVPREKRPTHRLPPFSWLPFSLPLVGKKVDSIEWARNEIVETTAALRESRRTLAQDVAKTSSPLLPSSGSDQSTDKASEQTYPPLNSAFVLFNEQLAAQLATQALVHHEPYRMSDRTVGVAPEDVVWSNLNMNPYEARARVAISWVLTIGLIIVWAIPVAFVGVVSNVGQLCTTYHWLAWVCKAGPITGVISGILPPVLLAVLMMLLPVVLRLLALFEGKTQHTAVELSLMSRYFLFLVIHSFLIVTLSSGLIAALPGLVENPASVPSLLADQLPKASTFFLTYIILQGLSGTATGFLQVVPLVLYYVKLFILGSTPRSIYAIKYTLRNVAWGTLFPTITLLTVITLAYSIISPIINGLACVTFYLFYQLWKYLFLWQLEQPRASETGGQFFPLAIQHVFVGMYLQQICLAALFFLAEDENKKASAVPEGALMIVLIAFTAFFHIIINNSYGPLIHSLPLTLADKARSFGTPEYDENKEAAARELKEKEQAELDGAIEMSEKRPRAPSSSGSAEARADVVKEAEGPDTGRHAEAEAIAAAVEADGKGSPFASKARISTLSVDAVERGEAHLIEDDGSHKDPEPIKGVDEDAGPKEFYHPASVEPQRIIWLPRDQLGLAEAEVAVIREKGIAVSLEKAEMDGKGHVDISGPPPEMKE